MQLKSSISIGNSPMATMIQKYSYLKVVPDSSREEIRSIRYTQDSARSKLSGFDGAQAHSQPRYAHGSSLLRSNDQFGVSSVNLRNYPSGPMPRGTLNFTVNTREPVKAYHEPDSNRFSVRSIAESVERRDDTQTGGSGSSRTAAAPHHLAVSIPEEATKKAIPALSMPPTQVESGSSDQHYEKILSQILSLSQFEKKDGALTYLRSLLSTADSWRLTTVSSPQGETEETSRLREEAGKMKEESAKLQGEIQRLKANLQLQAEKQQTADVSNKQLEATIESLNRRVVDMVLQIERKTAEHTAVLAEKDSRRSAEEEQLRERVRDLEDQLLCAQAVGDPELLWLRGLVAEREEVMAELTTKNEYLQTQ